VSALGALIEREGLQHVASVRAGGYSWAATTVYYKPGTGRFYWLSESGCSCNYFGDGSYELGAFGDGDREAALRALADVDHWEGSPSAEERAQAATALRDFREVPA